MKIINHLLYALLILSLSDSIALAQDLVPWEAQAYTIQFKHFQEQKLHSKESWIKLNPYEQNENLENITEAAVTRHAELKHYYDEAMKKWNFNQLQTYMKTDKDKNIKTVSFWLGKEKGKKLSLKILTLESIMQKAASQTLDKNDINTLNLYLKPEAIKCVEMPELPTCRNSFKSFGISSKNSEKKETDNTSVLKQLDLKSPIENPENMGMENLAEFYDGAASASGEIEISADASQENTKQENTNLQEESISFTKISKSAAPKNIPPKLNIKSTGSQEKEDAPFRVFSDAYGITIDLIDGQQSLSFRDGDVASAAIRKLPNGSITNITFYGHGGPGSQSVGNYFLDSDTTASLLKSKTAPGSTVQFSGCNTASIGEMTLNPLVGLSMGIRRIMYFSIPYFQERMAGKDPDEARRFWEGQWDKDLAKETSEKLPSSYVCGYRTFGLVPDRIPIISSFMGQQEATKPRYVLGKKVCYLNGREVKRP